MVSCVDRGGSTAWDVAGRVKWATGMLSDFEPHMQRAAVGETLAHLEYLFETGAAGEGDARQAPLLDAGVAAGNGH